MRRRCHLGRRRRRDRMRVRPRNRRGACHRRGCLCRSSGRFRRHRLRRRALAARGQRDDHGHHDDDADHHSDGGRHLIAPARGGARDSALAHQQHRIGRAERRGGDGAREQRFFQRLPRLLAGVGDPGFAELLAALQPQLDLRLGDGALQRNGALLDRSRRHAHGGATKRKEHCEGDTLAHGDSMTARPALRPRRSFRARDCRPS